MIKSVFEQLLVTENELIQACQKGDRKAQKQLYERLAAKMFGVCRRYIRNEADVEDTLLKGFFKVFSNIHRFEGKGSFEGWVRRIMVNESLMWIRKQKRSLHLYVEVETQHDLKTAETADQKIAADDILCLLDELPIGYRTVFNLFAIEGFSHKEIAEQLGVSINTSKSQLLKARKMLQKLLQQNEYRVA